MPEQIAELIMGAGAGECGRLFCVCWRLGMLLFVVCSVVVVVVVVYELLAVISSKSLMK